MKEILRDNDIAEHTLVVTVEAARRQIGTTGVVRIVSYMSTVLAAMEIHTVSRSPEPPRYLRAMVECCLSRYHRVTQNVAVVAGEMKESKNREERSSN
jgi:ferritin